MTNPLISCGELQLDHICKECGFCCLHGGQMRITTEELELIAKFLDVKVDDVSRIPVLKSDKAPDTYYLSLTAPCFFLDKATKQCIIYEVRPKACKDYPWVLHKNGGASLFDALVCPVAHDQIEQLINVLPVGD